MKDRVGDDPTRWSVAEVGDGNLNLVFIVEGDAGRHRQAGLALCAAWLATWPLPLKRAFFEYHAL
jgi:5-methylthioribose kinase